MGHCCTCSVALTHEHVTNGRHRSDKEVQISSLLISIIGNCIPLMHLYPESQKKLSCGKIFDKLRLIKISSISWDLILHRFKSISKSSHIFLTKQIPKILGRSKEWYSLRFKLDVHFKKITQFKKSGCTQINCIKWA